MLAISFRRVAFAVLPVLCVGCVKMAAQIPPPPPPPPSPMPGSLPQQNEEPAKRALATGTYRIAGRVLDAVSGRSLPRVTVTLADSDSGTKYATDAKTNEEGRFAIPNLPASKFRLQGEARGYVTAAYDEHESFSTAIVTGAGLDTESLVLKLQPAAMVSGSVTDEAGDPVRRALIALFRESTEGGTRRTTVFRNATTDDQGNYELTRLPPGTYFATVQGTPWYATHPTDDTGQPNGMGIAANVDPALDVTYPVVFYPEATDSSGATPIRLKSADRFTANFRLTPQPALRLLVRMQAPEPGAAQGPARFAFPQLQQKVFDSYQPVIQQRMQMSGSNMEIQGLPPGRYVMRQAGPNGIGPPHNVDLSGGSVTVEGTEGQSSGKVTITLAAPVGDKAAIARQAQSKTGELPNNITVLLRRDDDETGMFVPTSGRVKDGKAEIDHVEPGDYRVTLIGSRYYVESVTENGQTRHGSFLHVSGEGQTIAITLGSGSVALTGFVRQEGKGVAGAMIVLIPAGGDHSIDLYRRDQSDLDGSFRLVNVLPGNYLLISIHDGWSLEWGKPEALAPYMMKAVPVTVPPNGHGVVKIDANVIAQER